MSLLYVYILWVAACLDSISAGGPQITVSAPVGSTVVLPCKLTDVSKQTPNVRWRADTMVVFNRSSDGTEVGSGYEGRVDVPEDELRKGNCSLVLKNIKLTDDGVYTSFMVEHADSANTHKEEEICRVKLSVEALQVSSAVGSTVVLPCEYKDPSVQTPHVEWFVDREAVFERQGKESYQGKGYEGRVNVPEDELLKGNCSLVLKNVTVTDEAVYRSNILGSHIKKPVLVQKVQLSVYEKTKEWEKETPQQEKNEEWEKGTPHSGKYISNLIYNIINCQGCHFSVILCCCCPFGYYLLSRRHNRAAVVAIAEFE